MENEADKNILVKCVCAVILSLYVFSLSVKMHTNICFSDVISIYFHILKTGN